MPYIKVGEENSGSINLYYEDHGVGKPVILIHGWPLDGASWEKQQLALLGAGYRVITYDRRGFGQSSKPITGYDYDTFASDLTEVIKTLKLDEFSLAGFSMGTGEVTRYLSKYGSDNVNKAVLISSVPPYLLKTSDNPEGINRSVFDDIMAAIKADRPAYISQFLLDFYNMDVFSGELISKEASQNSWNVGVKASPKGTHDCVKAWLTDFREDIKKIDIPTLIIHGSADRILPIDVTGRRLRGAIKGSKYVEVKDAPHGMIWTHADKINNELLDFLE